MSNFYVHKNLFHIQKHSIRVWNGNWLFHFFLPNMPKKPLARPSMYSTFHTFSYTSKTFFIPSTPSLTPAMGNYLFFCCKILYNLSNIFFYNMVPTSSWKMSWKKSKSLILRLQSFCLQTAFEYQQCIMIDA